MISTRGGRLREASVEEVLDMLWEILQVEAQDAYTIPGEALRTWDHIARAYLDLALALHHPKIKRRCQRLAEMAHERLEQARLDALDNPRG